MSENTRKTIKASQGWEIVQSGRIALIEQANSIVSRLTLREAIALQSSVPRDIEFTQAECDCYEAALAFLQREFHKGPSPTRSELIKFDEDQSV